MKYLDRKSFIDYERGDWSARFGERLLFFIIFLLLSLITFGIYPLYYFLTRFNEMHVALEQTRDEVYKQNPEDCSKK
ncbi:DUF4234 domain-containing protein [Gammaproteobacteria bacterium]|nr:DUF4234 domain-containing protein [Gammaproteobacteria bacterium]